MGRILTVDLDEQEYYCMCRNCSTHLALMDDYFVCTTNIFPEQTGSYFRNAVNVQVDGPAHYQRVGIHTVAEIYCVTCRDKLGWKCIQVDTDQDQDQDQDQGQLPGVLREGNVKFITEKLSWKLTTSRSRDAGTSRDSGSSASASV